MAINLTTTKKQENLKTQKTKNKGKIMMSNETLNREIRRILSVFKATEAEIRPHFILTGPSGSGKTYTMQQLVSEFDLAFLEINAAQLTKEGTSGNSLSKALTPLLQMNGNLIVCFVDEFDKLFISGNSNTEIAHEVTTGVQNEFLKVLESDSTSVFGDYGKYIEADTSRVLFIFAGAFNGEENITIDRLREFGVKTEFLGRVGLAYSTNKFSLAYMIEILENSAILEKYLMLFPDAKRSHAIKTISEHLEENYEKNTIGVRLINTLIHQYFIKGGKLTDGDVKKVTFQKTLKL